MNLTQYLKKTGRSQSNMARALGVQRGMISHLVAGIRRPSLALALRISVETGGAVPVTVWPATPRQALRARARK